MLKKILALIITLMVSLSGCIPLVLAVDLSQYDTGINIINIMDFSADSSMVGRTINGWSNWTLTSVLNPATLTSTIALDPDTPDGTRPDDANKVLQLRRTATGSDNERPYYRVTADNLPVQLTGVVSVSTRIRAAKIGGAFVMSLRDSVGRYVAISYFHSNGSIFSEVSGAIRSAGATYPSDEWFDFTMEANTHARTFDIYINGSKVNTTPLDFYFPSADYAEDIGRVEFDSKRDSLLSETLLYFDDIVVWQDYSADIALKSAMLTETSLTDESLASITKSLNQLETNLGDGFSVDWSSDNPMAVSNTGAVTTRNFTQYAKLTAKIIRDAQVSYVRNAHAYKEFDLTVLPFENASTEDFLQDIKDYYLIDSLISSENLNEITGNLSLPLSGPDGVTFAWHSDNQIALSDTGVVTRPSSEENDAVVILTADITKDDITISKNFELIVKKRLSPEQMIALAMEEVTYRDLTVESPDNLTLDLTLPTAGLYNTAINWEADYPTIISSDGVVTRPSVDTAVVLTATFTNNGVSLTKAFSFTVKMSAEAKLSIDGAAINLGDITNIITSFKLPDLGHFYRSAITWTSDNGSVITIDEYTANVKRPDYLNSFDTHLSVRLIAELVNEGKKLSVPFYVSVARLPSDEQFVQDIYDYLTFDKISLEASDEVSLNLALPEGFEGGITCVWSSSNEAVIEKSGKVISPAPGNPDANVTLTVKITKRGEALTKTFNVTVKAFPDADSLLRAAASSLVFSSISNENILNVTEDLTLPSDWLFGTSISWSSEDRAVIDIISNGSVGRIYRPDYGFGSDVTVLTAQISYGGQSVSKSFSIKVKEKEQYTVAFDHNNENLDIGSVPTAPGGSWEYLNNNYRLLVSEDPFNTDNQVVEIGKNNNVQGTYSDYYIYIGNTSYTGLLTATGRIYVSPTTQGYFWYEIRGVSGAQAHLRFENDGSISTMVQINGTDVFVRTKASECSYTRGEWLNFRIELNTDTKYYHIYLDDKCITEDGNFYYNNAPYSTEHGMPFRYFGDQSRQSSISGYRISIDPEIKSTDTLVYIDDLFLHKLHVNDPDLLEACAEFERVFLSNTNMYALTEDLVLPTSINGVSLEYYSSNSSVINEQGKVTRGDETEAVTFTVRFVKDGQEFRRPFKLNVISAATTNLSDAEAAAEDLAEIIEGLKAACTFNNITSNMPFIYIGKNGSTISYESDMPAIISNSGITSPGSSDQTVKITISAVKNGERVSDVITLVVKAAPKTGSSGGGGGGAKQGGSPVYGAGTIPNSGIDLDSVFSDSPIFSDVPRDFWCFDAIESFAGRGIVNGKDKNTFAPNESITREEFAKILVGAFGLRADSDPVSFNDVLPTDWYYEYVNILSSKQIIYGKGDRLFGVGEKISKQDMAVMVHRAAISKLIKKRDYTGFSDDSQISDYAKQAIIDLYEAEILNGKGDNLFAPTAYSTRAEALFMIYMVEAL